MENRAPQDDPSQDNEQEQDNNHNTGETDNMPTQGRSLSHLHAQLVQDNTSTPSADEEEGTTHTTDAANEGEPTNTNTKHKQSNHTTARQPPTQ